MNAQDLHFEASRLLGEEVCAARPLAGGDLSSVLEISMASGKSYVAKSGPAPELEGEMLRAISAAGAPAPDVISASEQVLIMSCLPSGGGGLDTAGWNALGRALRVLHDHHGQDYGWPQDYAFGDVAIGNKPCANWLEFWAENRIRRPAAPLPSQFRQRLDHMCGKLDSLLPERPAPALLHGDLWVGNLLSHQGRFTGFIDPACYYGDAEVDLAMLHLFGTPSPAFWEGYGDVAEGWRIRCAAYQVWPALVHVRLFGAGYHGMLDGLLRKLGC